MSERLSEFRKVSMRRPSMRAKSSQLLFACGFGFFISALWASADPLGPGWLRMRDALEADRNNVAPLAIARQSSALPGNG